MQQLPVIAPHRGGAGGKPPTRGVRVVARPGAPAETGGVIVGGLLKVVVAVLLLGLVVYEAGAITVNYFQLDDLAGQAVRAGASTPPQQRTHATVERAVLAALEGSDARLDDLDVGAEEIALTISRPARVLLLDRIPPAEGLITAEQRKRAAFR